MCGNTRPQNIKTAFNGGLSYFGKQCLCPQEFFVPYSRKKAASAWPQIHLPSLSARSISLTRLPVNG